MLSTWEPFLFVGRFPAAGVGYLEGMLPIRMGVLEMPRANCRVHGARQPERLSQCLMCGSLIWSRPSDGEPECRCSIACVMRDVAKEPQMADSAA